MSLEPDPPTDGRLARIRATLRRAAIRKGLLLTLVCTLSALLLMDYARVPEIDLKAGDVAPYDLRAPVSFSYVDEALTRELQREAEAAVTPVYDYNGSLTNQLQNRITLAFDSARRKVRAARAALELEPGQELPPQQITGIANDFLRVLEFGVTPDEVEPLVHNGFHEDLEALALNLVSLGMRQYVIAERTNLPATEQAVTVVRIVGDARQEVTLDSYEPIRTPEAVRKEITYYVLQHKWTTLGPDEVEAAAAVARAAIRPNFSFNQLLTEERKRDARNSVATVVHRVKRGTNLFRAGDVLDQGQVDMLQALQEGTRGSSLLGEFISLFLLTTLLVTMFYLFATGYVRRFVQEVRSLEAMGFILLLCLALARATVEASGAVPGEGAGGPLSTSLWYMVPLAGGAMLVRILANSESALVFAVVSALLAGVMMEGDGSFTLFFLVSGVTAAGSISQTHERLHVLRAGLQAAIVNAGLIVVLDLTHLYVGTASNMGMGRFFWDGFFGVLGGLLSAVMVLGLVPFFELFGFVTDYKLLELSSHNHPLLRQLMLRAPGTYHHSVIVGSLCEAAAESIGANALSARVAAYFHDIGKAVRPHYFVENQRDIPNPHDRLEPRRSAAILVSHVRDGAALAREHHLPETIVNNIFMHHGTGLIAYFYDRARQQEDGHVDPEPFRYPGPRPDTREAGILHLADKVEAASRALEHPTREQIRQVIQNIVSSVIGEGQLERCPLTLKELYKIAYSFEDVLTGIYHHRIEYPAARPVSSTSSWESAPVEGTTSAITLDFQNPLANSDADTAEEPDGRNDENLAQGEGTAPEPEDERAESE